MSARTFADVERDAFTKRGHTEYVGCGPIEIVIAHTTGGAHLQFRFKDRRIGRAKAEQLFNSWTDSCERLDDRRGREAARRELAE